MRLQPGRGCRTVVFCPYSAELLVTLMPWTGTSNLDSLCVLDTGHTAARLWCFVPGQCCPVQGGDAV